MAGKYLDGTGLSQVWDAVKNRTSQTLTAAKNYTDTKISALVNSAPETLDTLAELAAAYTENKEITDALNEAIGNKANKTDLNNYLPLSGGTLTNSLRIFSGSLLLGQEGTSVQTQYFKDGIGASRYGQTALQSDPNKLYSTTLLFPYKSGQFIIATTDDLTNYVQKNLSEGSMQTVVGGVSVDEFVVGKTSTQKVRYTSGGVFHKHTENGIYYLTLPNKTGTVATLDDIPTNLTGDYLSTSGGEMSGNISFKETTSHGYGILFNTEGIGITSDNTATLLFKDYKLKIGNANYGDFGEDDKSLEVCTYKFPPVTKEFATIITDENVLTTEEIEDILV